MKKSKYRRALLSLLILLFIAFSAALIIPKAVDLNSYRDLIVGQIEKNLRCSASVGEITWGIANGVWVTIENVSITGATELPINLNISSAYAKLAILPLFSKTVEIKELILDGPDVALKLEPRPNGANQAEEDRTSSGGPLPVAVSVAEITIRDGSLRVENGISSPDRRIVHAFKAIDITTDNMEPGSEIDFQLSMEGAEATELQHLQLKGSFMGLTSDFKIENPKLRFDARIASLGIANFTPYLETTSLGDKLGGSVSLDARYDGDLFSVYTVEGSADLTGVAYQDPSLWDDPLPGGKTVLSYKVAVAPDNIGFDDLSLRYNNSSAKAHASIKGIKEHPALQGLTISSTLSLEDLPPLVPWKRLGELTDKIRPVLQAGGTLKIESLSVGEIALAGPLPEPADIVSGAQLAANVSDITIPPMEASPELKLTSGRLSLTQGTARIDDLHMRVGPTTLPPISAQVDNLFDDLQVAASLNGPLRIVKGEHEYLEPLLKENGFEYLEGLANIDATFKYDQKHPENWEAQGALVLEEVNAKTHPSDTEIRDLQGKILFSRAREIRLAVEGVSGTVNESPVKLSGTFTSGTPAGMLIDGKAYVSQLDLGRLDGLLPAARDMALSGKVDADLDFKIPFESPLESVIVGTLNTEAVAFRANTDMAITNTHADIVFNGDKIDLTRLDLAINDQSLHIEGKASTPKSPKISLVAQSDSLNVDKLLALDKSKDNSSSPQQHDEETKSQDKSLPSWARNLTADLNATIGKAQYKGQHFENIAFHGRYKDGVIREHEVSFSTAGGKIANTGRFDLRNLEQITFAVNPDIQDVQIEKLSPLFGDKTMPLEGPLWVKGQLQGAIGDSQTILASLKGNIKAGVGAGKLPEVKHFGKLAAQIFNFINVRGLFSGDLIRQMRNEGLLFKAIDSEATFNNGSMSLNHCILLSDSMNGNSQGIVDFTNDTIALQVVIQPFQTIDTVLGLVPILGRQAKKLTDIYLAVEGPLNAPKINTELTKGFLDVIKGGFGISDMLLKDTKTMSDEIEEYSKKRRKDESTQ